MQHWWSILIMAFRQLLWFFSSIFGSLVKFINGVHPLARFDHYYIRDNTSKTSCSIFILFLRWAVIVNCFSEVVKRCKSLLIQVSPLHLLNSPDTNQMDIDDNNWNSRIPSKLKLLNFAVWESENLIRVDWLFLRNTQSTHKL